MPARRRAAGVIGAPPPAAQPEPSRQPPHPGAQSGRTPGARNRRGRTAAHHHDVERERGAAIRVEPARNGGRRGQPHQRQQETASDIAGDAAPLQEPDRSGFARPETGRALLDPAGVDPAKDPEPPAAELAQRQAERSRHTDAQLPRRAGRECRRRDGRRAVVGIAHGTDREYIQREQLEQHADPGSGRRIAHDSTRQRGGDQRARQQHLREADQVESGDGAPRHQGQQHQRTGRQDHRSARSDTAAAPGTSCAATSAPASCSAWRTRSSSSVK